MEAKIEKLEEEICGLRQDIKELIKIVEKMNTSASRMDDHIDFVETTYDTLKYPLQFISNKINYIEGNKNLEITD